MISDTQGILDGKIVLVTGAAQGIGREVAVVAAREGAQLVLVDRSEQVASLIDELDNLAPRAVYVLSDLETWQSSEASINFALERFKRVDVCINAVGGTIWARPFEHYEPEKKESEFTRSLFPTLWMSRAVLPAMRAEGSGTIVNVSSIATRGINQIGRAHV